MEYPMSDSAEERYGRMYDDWFNGMDGDELKEKYGMNKSSIRTALWKFKKKHGLLLVRRGV